MAFHLGKPIAVMIVLAAGAGAITRFTGRPQARADLEMWSFAENHWKPITGYGHAPGVVTPLEQFEAATGLKVRDQMINNRAENARLGALFLADARGPEVPDVVELEIASVGQFFAQPADSVGLLPLDDLIARRGWTGRIVPGRLAAWSKDGHVFGIPTDVHPTVIAYNDDAFREAGVDLAACDTWQRFFDACETFQRRQRDAGRPNRYALELLESNAGLLIAMLLQRGVTLIDADGTLRLTDPRVLDTLVVYCGLLVGKGNGDAAGRVAIGTTFDTQAISQDFSSGTVNAMLAPDWRLNYIRDSAPDLAGKLRLMPLPRWPDSAYRTTTIGGSCAAIPRNSANPEAAFALIEHLFLKNATLSTGRSYLLPAVPELWARDARVDEADAFFSGQPVRRLLVELAAEVPPRTISPASTAAEVALSQVMTAAIGRLRGRGGDGFREYCVGLLDEAQGLVLARIRHGSDQR